MIKIRKDWALLALLFAAVGMRAQTTTTYTGTIKDLAQNPVTSGQVNFTLAPATDSTMPGVGRFSPTTVHCNINSDGTLSGYVSGVLSGACIVTRNTSLSPSGTSYRICIQPQYAAPGSCFYDYATTSTKDISTPVPTLATGPINFGGASGVQVGGDIGGTTTAPLVTGIQGRPVAATAPTTGQVPTWDGAHYVPATPAGGSTIAHTLLILKGDNAGNGGPAGSADVTGLLGYTPAQTVTMTGNLAVNVMADFNFSAGSGSALADTSGNGNGGTLGSGGAAPTWVQGGLSFQSGTGQSVALPAALNNFGTVAIAMYYSPTSTVAPCINQTTPGICAGGTIPEYNLPSQFPAWISSSTGSAGFSFMSGFPNDTYATPTTWNSGAVTQAASAQAGVHVYTVVRGTGGGNNDRTFIDTTETPYITQGSTAGAQSSGHLCFGSCTTSPWAASAPQGVYYRARFYSSQLTPADVAALANVMKADMANRGIQIEAQQQNLGLPQLQCVGDSITAGSTLSGSLPYCNLLALTNQPAYQISNWGQPGYFLQWMAAGETWRVGQQCQTTSGTPAVAHILAGINDLDFGFTPARSWADLQGEIQQLKRSGCIVGVATILSSAIADGGNREAFDDFIRGGYGAAGADFLDDMEADPRLGQTGAYADATCFNGGLHPTDACEPNMAAAMSNSMNAYFGRNTHTIVTATTHTVLAGERNIEVQPTGNTVLTLPNCIGQTDAGYRFNMNQTGTDTLSIKNALSTQPINGTDHSSSALLVLSGPGAVSFKDVADPPATSGCHWLSY